jgi:hypothetical protein
MRSPAVKGRSREVSSGLWWDFSASGCFPKRRSQINLRALKVIFFLPSRISQALEKIGWGRLYTSDGMPLLLRRMKCKSRDQPFSRLRAKRSFGVSKRCR